MIELICGGWLLACLACLPILVRLFRRAPVGYEDPNTGFHQGVRK